MNVALFSFSVSVLPHKMSKACLSDSFRIIIAAGDRIVRQSRYRHLHASILHGWIKAF